MIQRGSSLIMLDDMEKLLQTRVNNQNSNRSYYF